MQLFIKHWNIGIIILTLFKVICALNCTDNDNTCYVKPGAKSFAEQVIEAGKKYSNMSFTILVYAGNYNATNGHLMNFVNFTKVAIKKHPDSTMPVNIMCPGFTSLDDEDHINGVGFDKSMDIEISGINFMSCGSITSGLYFRRTFNLVVRDSVFHHNVDNGIQLFFGNNITIINCSFYSNIGVQPDVLSDLIISNVIRLRGVGLGLFFEDQNNISVTIKSCNFTNNIAYKAPDYDPTMESRPFGFIPFGIGGAIYLKLNRVNHSHINVSNSSFYNNTAIHQGGAIVMIPVNAANNTLNIFGCKFVGNKVLGFLLKFFNVIVNGTEVPIIDDFINQVNEKFSIANLNKNNLKNLTFDSLRPSGGSGGAIAVSLFGSVDHNVLRVSDSHFIENEALVAGAIDFIVRDLLSEVEDGVDSNQAIINKCIIIFSYVYI